MHPLSLHEVGEDPVVGQGRQRLVPIPLAGVGRGGFVQGGALCRSGGIAESGTFLRGWLGRVGRALPVSLLEVHVGTVDDAPGRANPEFYGLRYGAADPYPDRGGRYDPAMRTQIPTRGVVFDGPGRPTRIEELVLDPPGPGEVRVRMAAAGVCHSDLHVVDGEWERPTGVVLGHEGSAIIESIGDGVDDLAPGDLVVLAWTAPCTRCRACGRGEPWLCASPDGSGHRLAPELTRLHRPTGDGVGAYSGIGTFGEHQVVARSAAIRVDPRTPPEIAALIGCAVTTGVGAVDNTARVRAGESVVVIGLGGVGLSAVMGAAAAGAHPITAVDVSPQKLELARAAGAHRTLLAGEGTRAAGADHVLECIGQVEAVETAIALARPGGVITLVGMTPQGQRASFDVYRFVEDGKVVRGSNYGSAVPARDFPAVAAAYLAGRLPLDLLVTERIRLETLDDAFAAMRRGDGARRVILHGGGDGTPPAMTSA